MTSPASLADPTRPARCPVRGDVSRCRLCKASSWPLAAGRSRSDQAREPQRRGHASTGPSPARQPQPRPAQPLRHRSCAGSTEHASTRARAKSGRTQSGVKGKVPSHAPSTHDRRRRTSACAACAGLCAGTAASRRHGQAGGEQGRDRNLSRRACVPQQAAGSGSIPSCGHRAPGMYRAAAVLPVPRGCTARCPESIPVPRRCPGMTAPAAAVCRRGAGTSGCVRGACTPWPGHHHS